MIRCPTPDSKYTHTTNTTKYATAHSNRFCSLYTGMLKHAFTAFSSSFSLLSALIVARQQLHKRDFRNHAPALHKQKSLSPLLSESANQMVHTMLTLRDREEDLTGGSQKEERRRRRKVAADTGR